MGLEYRVRYTWKKASLYKLWLLQVKQSGDSWELAANNDTTIKVHSILQTKEHKKHKPCKPRLARWSQTRSLVIPVVWFSWGLLWMFDRKMNTYKNKTVGLFDIIYYAALLCYCWYCITRYQLIEILEHAII